MVSDGTEPNRSPCRRKCSMSAQLSPPPASIRGDLHQDLAPVVHRQALTAPRDAPRTAPPPVPFGRQMPPMACSPTWATTPAPPGSTTTRFGAVSVHLGSLVAPLQYLFQHRFRPPCLQSSIRPTRQGHQRHRRDTEAGIGRSRELGRRSALKPRPLLARDQTRIQVSHPRRPMRLVDHHPMLISCGKITGADPLVRDTQRKQQLSAEVEIGSSTTRKSVRVTRDCNGAGSVDVYLFEINNSVQRSLSGSAPSETSTRSPDARRTRCDIA